MSIFTLFKPSASSSPSKPTTQPKTQPPKTEDVTTQQSDTKQIVEQAQNKAREIILEAKDEAFKLREKARAEAEQLKQSTEKLHQELEEKTRRYTEVKARLEERDSLTQKQLEMAQKRLEEVEKLRTRQIAALENISGLTKEEAKKRILELVEKRSVSDIAKSIKSAEEKARAEADVRAREILVDSMYAGATDYVAEYTVTTIKLPDDEAKGRIIGKEGRNIRAFEKYSGVDLDMDEAGVIKLSSFDSIRREIARVALERLIKDGRIHPTHIEEFLSRAKRDIERVIYQEGEKLCHAVGVYDLPRELVSLLGRFKYRTSYGQNMIAHTLEETKIGIKLAQEVGANVHIVRLGCLLHDIGKVVEGEGSHVELGVKVLKKYNLPKPAIDAVAQHHEDEEFSAVESILVYIADAISGARPGARYENYDEYVQRLEKLEEIATSHPSVAEAYAIQAGREVRVIVSPEKISDDACVKLASDIKQEIEDSLTYPGTVKVNVIRETRASAVAQ